MRYVILMMLVAGCSQIPEVPTSVWKSTTPEERAEYEARERRAAALEQEKRWNNLIAYHEPFCTKLGFEPGTDGWRNCLMTRINMADERAYAAANRGVVCTMAGRTMVCY